MEHEPFVLREFLQPFKEVAAMFAYTIFPILSIHLWDDYTLAPTTNVMGQGGIVIPAASLVFALLVSSTIGSPLSLRRRILILSALIDLVIAAIMMSALYYKTSGLWDVKNSVLVRDKWTCLYFSISTWTSLGLGDYLPGDAEGRTVVAIETIVSHITTGLFFVILVVQIAVKPRDDRVMLHILRGVDMLIKAERKASNAATPKIAAVAQTPGVLFIFLTRGWLHRTVSNNLCEKRSPASSPMEPGFFISARDTGLLSIPAHECVVQQCGGDDSGHHQRDDPE